jgi:hypothetical protein
VLAAEAAPRANVARRVRLPAPQTLVVIGAAVAGARLGLRPISDNSTLVHLRTGLELVRTGHVPRSDPYSFTAPGHRWVVQSWLASLLYGAAYRVGGHLLVALQAALMAATAGVVALAARSTTAWRSGVAATIAIAASAPGWSPRPLMFELLCLALVVLIVERRAHPLWLVPVVWVWVNAHGSYPLGLAWLVARAAGEAIDERGWPRRTIVPLGAFVLGLAVAVVNPLTWRLLTFPFVALHKRAVFQGIVEWRSPNFQSTNSLVALIFIAAGLMVLFRARLPWADALPVIGFLALALIAERNLAPFGVVLAPALAHALSSGTPTVSATPTSSGAVEAPARVEDRARDTASRIGRSPVWRGAACAAAAALVIVLAVRSAGQPVLNLSSYPVAAVNYLETSGRLGPNHHIAEIDVVGCYLVWRAGPSTKVFIDDRYDMYPATVVADAGALGAAQGGERRVLDTYHVDTVLWPANAALASALPADGGWQKTFDDGHWVVFERVSSPV